MKVCNICNESKPLSEFYSQKKRSKKLGEYIYHQPYCKECAKKKTVKWQEDNEEVYREKMKIRSERRWERPEKKVYQRNWAKEQRVIGYYRDWQGNNKDKIKLYNEQHRDHDISDVEWFSCKEYFNNECAYCGLHINDHYIVYGEKLTKTDFHREHVHHDGANDLSNCIPACRDCNSNKWKYEFAEWYSDKNELYDVNKLNKIVQWLETDYLKYINTIN